VARAASLHRPRERRERGLTLLEGPLLVAEAVAAGARLTEVFGLGDDESSAGRAAAAGAAWIPVTAEVHARLASTEHPRGPVAVLAVPAPAAVSRDAIEVRVADPGNAGTLVRSAAAFGLDAVFPTGAVDPWAPKVLRAGAGAHFHTWLGDRPDPASGRIGTAVADGVPADRLGEHLDPSRRWTVVVGTEARGLSAGDLAGCDVVVTIPMPGGVESLNAAVAGSIVVYELSRWRAAVGGGAPSI